MNISDLLPQVPIFCTLEPEEIECLRAYLEKVSLNENGVIFREKDPGDGLYIIALGAVRIVKMIDGSNEKTIAAMMEKDFFGEMSLLDGHPRSASAVAARSTVLLKLSTENFGKFMAAAPYSALKIISQIACHLAVRLRTANMRLAELENYRLLRSG